MEPEPGAASVMPAPGSRRPSQYQEADRDGAHARGPSAAQEVPAPLP